ncbi:hypothetical protein Lal_00050047 [Lupinus albus]|nr:hypothetical protein Lal_00050047 [Lupinus albus]
MSKYRNTSKQINSLPEKVAPPLYLITEILQMQMELQKRLHEQLKIEKDKSSALISNTVAVLPSPVES